MGALLGLAGAGSNFGPAAAPAAPLVAGAGSKRVPATTGSDAAAAPQTVPGNVPSHAADDATTGSPTAPENALKEATFLRGCP
jgi:hypothetical protein